MWFLVLCHAAEIDELHQAGMREAKAGDVDAAARLFERVSMSNLTLDIVADARVQLAMRALRRRPVSNASFHEALGYVLSALDAQPLPSAHLLAADLYRDIWYLDEAKASLREAIKQNPLDGFALTLLGQTHMEQGNFKSAKAAFRRAKTEHADYALAALAGDSGDFDRAPLSYVRDIFEVDERRHALCTLGACRVHPDNYVHVYGLAFHQNAAPRGQSDAMALKIGRPRRALEIGGCSPAILRAPDLGHCMDLIADGRDFLDAKSWDGITNLDVVVALDAAPYVGDLSILFSLVAQALKLGGRFYVTTDVGDVFKDGGHTTPALLFTGRWRHPRGFTIRLAKRFGLTHVDDYLVTEKTFFAWNRKNERVDYSDDALAVTNYFIFEKTSIVKDPARGTTYQVLKMDYALDIPDNVASASDLRIDAHTPHGLPPVDEASR